MLAIETIQITADLLELLSEIDEFKGAWRALGTIAPDRLNALRRVATIESIGSSTRIEGSKLSDREVEQVMDLANHPTTGNVGPWLGLGPDDSLLLLRDIGTQDIYALDWEEP